MLPPLKGDDIYPVTISNSNKSMLKKSRNEINIRDYVTLPSCEYAVMVATFPTGYDMDDW